MSHPVVTVGPHESAWQAASLLAERGFTALPVVNADGDLVGILTEADVLRERIQPDPRGGHIVTTVAPQTVGEIMTTDVVVMTVRSDVAEVARCMLQSRLRAIPIVEPHPAGDRLVGIVTRRDLMRCISRDAAAVAADVRHRLEIYGGPGRWTVTAKAGQVTITDERDSPTDRHAASVIAAAVPGVSSVRVTGWPAQG